MRLVIVRQRTTFLDDSMGREQPGRSASSAGLRGRESLSATFFRVERSTWRRVCCVRRGLHGAKPRHNAEAQSHDSTRYYSTQWENGRPWKTSCFGCSISRGRGQSKAVFCSEVMRNDVCFRHFRVRYVLLHSNATNPAEGVREPAHQEFNLGSAVEGFVFDQLRSTSLACGVMSG